ncbi:MAG: hypothetical protein IID41_14445 [Planctomycetes bacterium]|nr:hypothetical protein [Planctomycetota bacterium]
MTDITLRLKSPHEAQQYVLDHAKRFNAVACGRRWGKTDMGVEHLAMPVLLAGLPVGWFAPTYKLLDEAWAFTVETLIPFGPRVKIRKQERQITLPTGGKMDFWTLKSSTSEKSSAGRGRKYQRVIVDEAAHAPYLMQDWTKSIRPTLADLCGDAWFLTTPWGMNDFWQLWTKGESQPDTWASFQMPTSRNPFILPSEIEAARADLPKDAFAQEFEAEFLADAANPFGIDAIRACITDELAPGPPVAWGFDLAKSTDWTVGCALNIDGAICGFQRWQTDWLNTMHRVAAMIGDTPALIDATGVGDPIVEQVQRKCPCVEGFIFTSLRKQAIMEGLAVVIQQGRVSYARDLDVLVKELESFRYEYLKHGVRYEAPEGMHDDCVDALALAVECKRTLARGLALDVMELEGGETRTISLRRADGVDQDALAWSQPT